MANSEIVLKSEDLLSKLAEANSEFALDVYKQVVKKQKERSLFLSPFGISATLAMAYLGARGTTASQIADTLKWEHLGRSIHVAFKEYLLFLKKVQTDFTLLTANRLYVNNKANILAEYVETTKSHFDSEAVLVDFVGNMCGAVADINKWVEEQTNNKIKNVISATDIDSLTALILVNAIYFKGSWEKTFDSRYTSEGSFQIRPGEEVRVNMMTLTDTFSVGVNDELKCQVLEMPYKNQELSLFIFLPFDADGLFSLEEKLTHDIILKAMKQIYRAKVSVQLPKFKLDSRIQLKNTLSALGMVDVFVQGKSDLSGIDGTKPLHVSQVIHEAFVEFNEEGSEAAAATGVLPVFGALRYRRRIASFTADHPFLFLIHDNWTKLVLFLGRLVDPTIILH